MSEYFGEALELIRRFNVHVGDLVDITIDTGIVLRGFLMPRSRLLDDKHVVIKLENGYNVGLSISKIKEIKLVKHGLTTHHIPSTSVEQLQDLPLISIKGCGGTIASKIDYITGAVYPSFDVNDILNLVPEIRNIARIRSEEILNIFSEDMTSKYWKTIAERIFYDLSEGIDGVIIAHGTDTMGYTAAALSFAIQNLPVPVVLVGSQRSSDRPSTDASLNLLGAIIFAAQSSVSGVFVAMHKSTSDDVIAIHKGTRVRKCHTSRRDAFKSINENIIAEVKGFSITMLSYNELPRRDKNRSPFLKADFDDKVALIKTYPDFPYEIIDYIVDKGYHGLVIEGTGLGHTPTYAFKSISRACEVMPVVMVSQCLWGRINMNVYRTGRELLAMGVIPGEDMIPETAYVKLKWVLGQTQDIRDVKKLMLTNICGEISYRHSEKLFTSVIS
ncbi:MAG: Glu-tRNA(Gln) amidotransferase subunit GatD [Candidatus Methanomethylicia archaeon]